MKIYTLFGLILSLCLFVCRDANAQITFQKTFGDAQDDVANWVANTSAGFVVAGYTTTPTGDRNGYLLNLDHSGTVIWEKMVGGAFSDQFKVVLETSNGFMVLGETASYGAPDGEGWLLNFDANGTLLWSKTIGDSSTVETASSLTAVSGGRFLVSGTSLVPGMTDINSWFMLVDGTGATIWSQLYSSGETGNILHSNFVENGVIFASGSLQTDGGFVQLDLQTGDPISATQYFTDSIGALNYLQPTADSNLLICDYLLSASNSFKMVQWVNKITPDGQTLWSKVYSRPSTSLRGGLEDAGNDNFLLTPYDGDFTANGDAMLAKIDNTGNLLWSRTYGQPGLDWLWKSQLAPDGGFISVGAVISANGDQDVLVIKTDSMGMVAGCCIRPGDIVASDYQHADSLINITLITPPTAKDTTSQVDDLILAEIAYCGSLPTEVNIDTSLCSNVPFMIDTVAYFAPSMFDITIPGINSCDTIVHYNLIALPQSNTVETVMLCPGDSVSIGGQQYSQADTVVIYTPNLNGCDSINTYIISVLPQPMLFDSISFCVGDSITINGQVYTQTTTVMDTIPGNGACDTIVTYTLTQVTQQSQSSAITFCAGESVIIGGQVYTQSGMVIDTISGNGSCDTVVTYTLTMLPYTVVSDTISFCSGDSITINGQVYTQSATVVDTLAGNGVCDTLATYTLLLIPQPILSEMITFCLGDSITINGQVYTQSATVIDTIAGIGACDTIATYTLVLLPQPTQSDTISFCAGDSITINGQVYTQSATVMDTLSGSGACDTIVTYTLVLLPQPNLSEAISFCAGDSITINGQVYTQSATVTDTISSTTGCDTIVTYTLTLLPLPTRAETIVFCAGDTVFLGGQMYTQPGTVIDTLTAVGTCDTIVTYTLTHTQSGGSTVTIQCPTPITINSGTAPVIVDYTAPTATTTCMCPGIALTQTSGLASGSLFPLGITQVCYSAKDSCGNTASCCFNVTVDDQPPCDVKVIGCIRYELLSIVREPSNKLTYRIRVVNNCANKFVYTAIQLPNGVTGKSPLSNTIFTSEGGREYLVRNPNYSPFYSIRFKSTTDSISGGASDIFKYTLPPQSAPQYIHVFTRLDGNLSFEAYLNTFNCPVMLTSPEDDRDNPVTLDPHELTLFPNPTDGTLWVDLSSWSDKEGALQWRIFNSQGQQVMADKTVPEETLMRIDLSRKLNSGMYFFEIQDGTGNKETKRFVLQY